MNIKNAILNQIMQAVLANKDEYLAAIESAALDFIAGIKVDGHSSPVIEELKANVTDIIDKIQSTYSLLHDAIQQYGHPAVTTPTTGAQPKQ